MIRVFNEVEKLPKEQPMYLRLVPYQQGAKLIAVNEAGEKVHCGNIMTIRADGSFSLHECVNKATGLHLDEEGRPIVMFG